MTATADDAVGATPAHVDVTTDPSGTVIVTSTGTASATSAAMLSRALHTALDAALETGASTVLVDLGRHEAPAVDQVLRCAGERARSQHTDLQILPRA